VKIYTTIRTLQADLQQAKCIGKTIGFVPTMGALHEGHLSLIKDAQVASSYTVCSIFVNPTQFNDPKDLEKYPRPIDNDKKLLIEAGCDVLFLPSVDEMYAPNEQWSYALGNLDLLWEGANRPGHFQGVTQIVYKLFMAVQPDIAVFGQKDFQQCMVIAHLIESRKLPITLKISPTIREKSGLAMSSRNQRLTDQGKSEAAILHQLLLKASLLLGTLSNETIQEIVREELSSSALTLEYFGICRPQDLEPIVQFNPMEDTVLLIAAWIEGVRLIDNLLIKGKG